MTNISRAAASESSQWHAMSALPTAVNVGVNGDIDGSAHLPPWPRFSCICVMTMYLLHRGYRVSGDGISLRSMLTILWAGFLLPGISIFTWRCGTGSTHLWPSPSPVRQSPCSRPLLVRGPSAPATSRSAESSAAVSSCTLSAAPHRTLGAATPPRRGGWTGSVDPTLLMA